MGSRGESMAPRTRACKRLQTALIEFAAEPETEFRMCGSGIATCTRHFLKGTSQFSCDSADVRASAHQGQTIRAENPGKTEVKTEVGRRARASHELGNNAAECIPRVRLRTSAHPTHVSVLRPVPRSDVPYHIAVKFAEKYIFSCLESSASCRKYSNEHMHTVTTGGRVKGIRRSVASAAGMIAPP